MTENGKIDRVDKKKRRLVKSSVLAGAALVAGRLPYTSPRVSSFFGSSAFAQGTPVYSIDCSAHPTEVGPGDGVCNDANLVDVAAVVSPIPPTGCRT